MYVGVVVNIAVGAAVVFIVWGTVVSFRRRRRLMHATGPNFESFAGFYNSNPLRRGDDVNLTHIDDQGYRWDVSWLPGTQKWPRSASGGPMSRRTFIRTAEAD